MADPTIETFCCHKSTEGKESVDLISYFNSDSYNTVCLVSSSIGIMGAVYQILPRERPLSNHRWYSDSATRGRHIIVWLAIADLLASLGVFLRSLLWLNYKSFHLHLSPLTATAFCALSSAWIQYFYTATWLWTLFYAVDMRLVLREQEGHPHFYHLVVWLIPAVFTTIGLSILYIPDARYFQVFGKKFVRVSFYLNQGFELFLVLNAGECAQLLAFSLAIMLMSGARKYCQNINSISNALLRILPNYFANYLPMATVMIVNPVIYLSLSHDVERLVSRSLAQFTNKERQVVDVIKIKFLLINMAFYMCWLPNLINSVLIWTMWFSLPHNLVITLWYVMALMNPLQALFNSVVYRRWTGVPERVYIPCRRENICDFSMNSSVFSNKPSKANESTPLLTRSINSSTCPSEFNTKEDPDLEF